MQFLSLATSLTAFGESDVFNGTYTHSDVWPGAYHALRFANGSNSVVETTTTVKTFPFNNATAYYEYLCIPSNDTSSSSESSSNSTIPALKAPAGYPKPFSKDKWNRIMGFFPSSKGLEETAVLVVPTFDFTLEEQLLPNGEANFARVAREFIQNATSKGKKKMIVDLSGNGGGMVYAGMNLFKLFFPDQDIYSATRFRAHEGADIAGQAISSMPPEALNETLWLDWRNQFKPDQETGFESWKDLYGPNEVMGIQSSSLMASNISAASTSDEPVSGYGATKLDPAKPAFAAEDIILVRAPRHHFSSPTNKLPAYRWTMCIYMHDIFRAHESPRCAHYCIRRTSRECPNARDRRCKGRPNDETFRDEHYHGLGDLHRRRSC